MKVEISEQISQTRRKISELNILKYGVIDERSCLANELDTINMEITYSDIFHPFYENISLNKKKSELIKRLSKNHDDLREILEEQEILYCLLYNLYSNLNEHNSYND